MSLSREEIEQIARSTAQTVLEGLHRYTVAFKKPETIEQGLQESMIEERTAADWYRKRSAHATTYGGGRDQRTSALYDHIAAEEDHHYDELNARLQELSKELTPDTISHLATTEENPVRKFCCRQCGECAPSELLEEGKFPERIAWLREHYKQKHPGVWGEQPPPPEVEIERLPGESVEDFLWRKISAQYEPKSSIGKLKVIDVAQWAKNMDMISPQVKWSTGSWRDAKVYGGIQNLIKLLKLGDTVFVKKVTLETTLFYSLENVNGQIEVTDRSFPTEASE